MGVFSLARGNPTSQTFADWPYLHTRSRFLDSNPLFASTIHLFFLESLFLIFSPVKP